MKKITYHIVFIYLLMSNNTFAMLTIKHITNIFKTRMYRQDISSMTASSYGLSPTDVDFYPPGPEGLGELLYDSSGARQAMRSFIIRDKRKRNEKLLELIFSQNVFLDELNEIEKSKGLSRRKCLLQANLIYCINNLTKDMELTIKE